MKKNLLTIFISALLSLIFCYIGFFIYHFFKDHEKNTFLFKSIEQVNFNKFYSDKLHHLRGHWKIKESAKPENYLFTIINNFKDNKKNILIQGDSWIEQLNETENFNSFKEIYNFTNINNLGFINSGITSYSPSLMQIQLNILEKDFNIKPNIVIAYIDQTDIGDELCRYKYNRKYDDDNNLISVINKNYSRSVFEYTRINNISEIILLNNSKLLRTYHLTNFFIKYSYYRALNKFIGIKKYGWKNRNIRKCHFSQITNYLNKIDNADLLYFEERIKDYLKVLLEKKHIDNIILITFPHYNHLYEQESNKKYNVNVSNIVDKFSQSYDKVYHLNFSDLIINNKISFDSSAYKNDKSHLKERYYIKIFLKNIKNIILEKIN